jgi:hypothetical protein
MPAEFVSLKGGPTVPEAVLGVAIDLDLRGFALSHQNGTLLVRPKPHMDPKPELSEEERSSIRRWKQHLLSVVVYCESDH